MHATLLYAGLIGILFIWLSAQVILLRRKLKISRGDGGNPEMARVRGIHMNTAQYVPLALVMMGFCEASGAPGYLIHALGVVLVISRVIYVYGGYQEPKSFRFRVLGMVGTFLTLGTLSAVSIAIGALGLMR